MSQNRSIFANGDLASGYRKPSIRNSTVFVVINGTLFTFNHYLTLLGFQFVIKPTLLPLPSSCRQGGHHERHLADGFRQRGDPATVQ